jgi:uncharacterized protein YdiU (UPF0061 family)
LGALESFGGAIWDNWLRDWTERLDGEFGPDARADRAAAMDRINPLYIPRNHLIEDALAKAEAGDLSDWKVLLDVVRQPYVKRSGWEAYTEAGPEDAPAYRTFCGT